jgi:hypothetical protein
VENYWDSNSTMDFQYIIVAFIILSALGYATWMFIGKTKAFSKKPGCADDCGCSSKTTTPKIAN